MSEAVKVMVRCRPMNSKQNERGCINVVEVDSKNNQINLIKQDSRQQPKSFSFDFVFAPDSAQSLIYEQSAFSLVDSVLDGYNGTIFAYGQTGCGKTHTMMGSNQSEESRGIIPRTFSQIITITKNETSKNHLIRCSFIQIYNEEIHDLLSKDIKTRMDLKESPQKGVFVKDLIQIQVDTIAKMEYYMDIGFKNRATRATNMNNQSSRSHSIFTIYIDSQESDQKGNQKYKASKLNLVDLAGSERISKTGTTGQGMKQATKINLSLSALGNVISSLVDGKTHHIPYRDSKLTRLLQDSLGGNTKTIMIAAVSPANYNYDETLSTLRYASRAKFIQNKPKINQDPKDALLREYMQEIKKLKMMLDGKGNIQLNGNVNFEYGSPYIQEKIIYKEGENKENNSLLEQELRNKQNQLRNELEQKETLKQKLDNLQKHFEKGLGPDNSDKNELQKIKKLKQKLRVQRKKQQQMQRQKQKREQQLLNIEKNYKSLNEQVDEMKFRFKQIKNKYVANLEQLKDIKNEHQDQKQQLLDTIRQQQKQIKKFSSILNMIMNNEQIQHIVNNSEWSQQKMQWNIPFFTFKERNMGLPKLANSGMIKKQSFQFQKDKKQIIFRNSQKQTQKSIVQNGFRVNHIVKNARQVQQTYHSTQSVKQMSGMNRGSLTPLKNDAYQKAKVQMQFKNEEKRRKTDKLDPIDSRKYL